MSAVRFAYPASRFDAVRLSPSRFAAGENAELAELADGEARLLDAGSLGITYPSVRWKSGTNPACFRPAVVGNVRRGGTWRLTWTGTESPRIEAAKPAAKRGGKRKHR